MLLKIKFLLFAVGIFALLNASILKSDEYVMFIPSIAYDIDNETTGVEVKAYVYEKERRLGATTALSYYLGINRLNAVEKQRLYDKSALFRIDYESDKEFFVTFKNKNIYKMPKTIDGKSYATIKMEKPANMEREIAFEVYNSKYPKNTEKGFALYSSNDGISAIFDIDDTIKNSNVLDKKALLINTFLNEYTAVESIQEIFKHVQNLRADTYHYVSASPTQLYPALKSFFEKENIPKGTFHLRDMTDLSDFIPNQEITVRHKKETIEKLFKVFPKRKFILVGDSGENDPEIYAYLSRKYPDKVLLIIIRNITDEDKESLRFKEIDKSKFILF